MFWEIDSKYFYKIRGSTGTYFIYNEASDKSLGAHVFFILCHELAKLLMKRRRYVGLDPIVSPVSVLISRGIGYRYKWES